MSDSQRPAPEFDLTSAMTVWRTRDPQEWRNHPERYVNLAEQVLRLGEPLVTYDIAAEGGGFMPDNIRLRQIQALALARSGAAKEANAILRNLLASGVPDEETLGIFARTEKDLGLAASSPDERFRHFRQSADAYTQAYRLTGRYWAGVNAATMAYLIGRADDAKSLATSVRTECLAALRTADDYWTHATLGEAALILGLQAEAENHYRHAAARAGKRFADIHSSRRNARLLLSVTHTAPEWIDRLLCIPSVIAFSGHMIDQPGRSVPRFPACNETHAADAVAKRIEKLSAGFGYAAAACGSDILFLEAMLQRGGEIVVVLPYPEEEFIRDSVAHDPTSNWTTRFAAVTRRASRVVIASPERLRSGGVSFDYNNALVLGLAKIRSRQLETGLTCLAVWDGKPGDGSGGTASAVESWRQAQETIEIIELRKAIHRAVPTESANVASQRSDNEPALPSVIAAMLFADAVNFSKLREAEVPLFVERFAGAIAALLARFADSARAKNTWGDGFYFVFDSVASAGAFWLDLSDLVTETDWRAHGLPNDLSLRIALHAGPVYELDDPITGRTTFCGTHVSRAARIEPITPPGRVYASEAFAALAAATPAVNFTCEYAGQTPLAKGYGTFATYAVKRIAA